MDTLVDEIHLSYEDRKHLFNEEPNDITDVIVKLENGSLYTSSFYSYDKIEALKHEHEKNKEYLGGKYFWSKNLILIDSCNRASIEEVIDDMLKEGNFYMAFKQVV